MLTWQQQHDIEQRFYPDYTGAAYGRLRDHLARALTPGTAVLDAGSGPGTWLLRRFRNQVRPAGVDLFVPAPRPVFPYAVGSLAAIPYRSTSFDVVLCYDVVEHLDAPDRVFSEFWRVLKPGGLLFVKTPNLWGPTTVAAAVLPHALHVAVHRGLGTRPESVFPTRFRGNTSSALARLATSQGFRVESLYTVDETAGYFAFVGWSYALALLYSRVLARRALAPVRNGLIGWFRRPAL